MSSSIIGIGGKRLDSIASIHVVIQRWKEMKHDS